MRGTNRRDQDKGAWGSADQLPSGNWRAMYWHEGRRHKAPHTFKNKTQARAWLAAERARRLDRRHLGGCRCPGG